MTTAPSPSEPATTSGSTPANNRWQRLRTVARERYDRWVRIARLLPEAGWPLVTGGLALALVLGVLPLALIVLLGRVLYLLPAVADGGSSGDLVRTFAAAVVVLVVQQGLAPFQTGVVEVVARRVDEHCVDRLLVSALRDAPMATLDDPVALDLLADARGAFARASLSPGDASAALIPLVSRYVQLVGASVLVGVVVSPVAGVLILATALAIRAGQRGSLHRWGAVWRTGASARRRNAYLRDLATTGAVTKEVRLLGLLDWLRGRLRVETLDALRPLWSERRRILFWPFVRYAALALVGGGIVLVLVAHQATSGGLDLFALGVALQAVLVPMRFGVYFPECDIQTEYGMLSHDSLEEFEQLTRGGLRDDLRDGPRHDLRDGPRPTSVAGPGTFRVVRFEGVSFRYSDDAPWVLRHLDLELVAGRSTALVGLNGAGKTTLVKLLAGLYPPTEGRITVDGVDLASYPRDQWHRRLALIFQDYVRLELPLADNVSWGAPHLHDDPRALAAAVDEALAAAGADVVVDKLPAGLGTVLASGYPDGQDLSGGQWQRVALARALLAVGGGARVLVLDEPTAQLDVRAEAEFFDRFLAPGAVGASDDVMSVVISHRFSTVRPADRIVVLEHGRIVEQGDHDELVALGGRYAELFELQASRFRPGTPTTPTSQTTATTAGGNR